MRPWTRGSDDPAGGCPWRERSAEERALALAELRLRQQSLVEHELRELDLLSRR